MKKNRLHIIIVLTILTTGGILNAQAPYFQLQDLENRWVLYDDVKGEELTVIDFWATWCQPCLRSIPEINSMVQDYQGKGVNFIGISVDGPRNQAKLMPFAKSMGIEYRILRDVNSEAMADMNITSVPTLLIFDKEGALLFQHEGFHPGDETLIRKEIEKLL